MGTVSIMTPSSKRTIRLPQFKLKLDQAACHDFGRKLPFRTVTNPFKTIHQQDHNALDRHQVQTLPQMGAKITHSQYVPEIGQVPHQYLWHLLLLLQAQPEKPDTLSTSPFEAKLLKAFPMSPPRSSLDKSPRFRILRQ